ncbi:uncharacterized protein LOC133399467 [Phycodurus eques]|uniref:uncharacterized protein LOC133399467 n=1 Tax=Phycodurus eques TaxID=693459 RepID=UPI002ACDB258|nr:uncharacterized protein LOC133399467 [Phycodurus eques]
MGRCVGGIEVVFKVFSSPTHNVSSRGHQRPIPTIHSVDGALLPPPEAPDGRPEFPQSHQEVFLHCLTELLPCSSFCLSNHYSCIPLGQPVPISCLRSPKGQKGPIELFLQHDSIPYRQSPPTGTAVAATTGTHHLTATAPVGHLSNGGVEHGPLGLSVPRLPGMWLKEVEVGTPSDRGFCQTFPADPHNTFGFARSERHLPPPLEPTHHQVVISR